MSASIQTTALEGSCNVRETAGQRKSCFEITKLAEAVGQSSQYDEMTTILKSLTASIQAKLSQGAVDAALLQEKMIDCLQALLMNLDDPWLGSDGKVYDGRALTVYYSLCPFNKLDQSPEGESDFFVVSHQAAQICIDWLKQKGKHQQDDETLKSYESINKQGLAIPLPRETNRQSRKNFWMQLETIRRARESLLLAQSLVNTEQVVSAFEEASSQFERDVKEKEKQINALVGEKIDRDQQEQALFLARSGEIKQFILQEERACDQLQKKCFEVKHELEIAESASQQLHQILDAFQAQLAAIKKQQRRAVAMKAVCFAFNIGFSVFMGGALIESIALQFKTGVVDALARATIKDSRLAALVSGAVNGSTDAMVAAHKVSSAALTQAGSSMGREALKGVVRGVAAPVVTMAIKNPMLGSAAAAVVGGALRNGPLTGKEVFTAATLGAASDRLAGATGVMLQITPSREGDLSVTAQVKN